MRAPAFVITLVAACSALAVSCAKTEKHPPRDIERAVTAPAVQAPAAPAEQHAAVPEEAPPKVEAKPAADTPPVEGGCAFEAPQFFGGLPGKWEGGCEGGQADGLGVLRSFDGKKVMATFYGTMERGNPKVGVVEDRDGLIIGRFAPGGKPIDSDVFKDRLDAVNEAVAAATELKESYERAGNKASAAFYGKKVKMLNKQIE